MKKVNKRVGDDYYLLERNFRCRIGEIDIIAFDKKEKKIVELLEENNI